MNQSTSQPDNQPPFLTPTQIAERYAVGVGRVISWIRRGDLKAVNVSVSTKSKKTQFRIPVDAMEQFEAARTKRPKPMRRPRRQPYVRLV